MILDILYIIVLFVVAIGILPLYGLLLWTHARSKRAIIEGMAQLDKDTRLRLGWMPQEYIGMFDLRAPFRLGWQSWGLLVQQQNWALQRVVVRGLPKAAGLSTQTLRSARRYRLCFWAIALLAAVFFVPFFIGLSRVIAEFSGIPLGICCLLVGVGVGFGLFTPIKKFQRWPEIEGRP